MPRSSFGPRRGETSWAALQTPKAQPRVVRMGRPANDNFRRRDGRTWILIVGLAGAALALMAANWRFF